MKITKKMVARAKQIAPSPGPGTAKPVAKGFSGAAPATPSSFLKGSKKRMTPHIGQVIHMNDQYT